MPIYRVTLKEPTTPYTPFLIRAPLPRVAQRAALCLLQASVPKAAQGAMPNLDPDLTTCVQVHDSGYPEAGPVDILERTHHRPRTQRGALLVATAASGPGPAGACTQQPLVAPARRLVAGPCISCIAYVSRGRITSPSSRTR